MRFHPVVAISALLLGGLWLAGVARAETEASDAPDLATRTRELERRVAELSAADPAHPDTLQARLEHARLLHEAGAGECTPALAAAERELAPLAQAGPGQFLAWPDGPGDSLSLLQSVQISLGACAEDDASARSAFETAIATGGRAIEALRENWDYPAMAVALFNVAYARRALGDLDGALRDLEQVIAWDLEFGMWDELARDYSTLVRWSTGEDPDPADVRQFTASYQKPRARFRFDWKPHRSRWSTRIERAALDGGAVRENAVRYQAEVTARREGGDWVISAVLPQAPEFEVAGAAQSSLGAEALRELISGIARTLPEIVVAADGSFKAVRDLEAFRAALDRELGRNLKGAPAAAAAAPGKELMEALRGMALDPERMTSDLSGHWDLLVAAWIDTEFDHGDWYQATVEEPLPGFSERPVKMTWSFKVARWLPCTDGGERNCVELLVKVAPDGAQVRDAIGGYLERAVPAAGREFHQAFKATNLRLEYRYRLVTEADTLRPWSLEQREYYYGSWSESGRHQATARFDRTLETAQYLE